MTATLRPVVPGGLVWHSPSVSLHPYFVLDVFTSRPLEGNQLGLFDDGRPFSGEQMQALAREMNFAETVFLLPPEQGGDARVRIFTPGTELPFAGHPVLGTAFVVAGALGKEEVRLETGIGEVPITLEHDGGRVVFGRMQQPIPTWAPCQREQELLAALGVERSQLPIEAYTNGPRHLYVNLSSEEEVAALQPDLAALKAFDFSVNCFAGSGSSWKTRMFAPAWGVPEDPATGSSAGPLAVHLARHGLTSFGDQIEIRQGFEIARPSYLYARVEGSPEQIELVEVGGSAVIVSRGHYLIDQPNGGSAAATAAGANS